MESAREPRELVVWARQEFGTATLGDLRRQDRLIAIAAGVAKQPRGTVAEIFQTEAEREATYRFIENEAIVPSAIGEPTYRATAQRSEPFPYVFVAVDATSLTLTDRTETKGFGPVGTTKAPAQGLHVMNALAVCLDGTPLGLCNQIYWNRSKEPKKKGPKNRNDRANFQNKETRYWVDTLATVAERFACEAPDTKPWFQLDRGADCWPVLKMAVDRELLLTVRAQANRRVLLPSGKRSHLWFEVLSTPVLGRYDIMIPAAPGRDARIAHMEVRACPVELELRTTESNRFYVTVNAVLAREIGAPTRLQWMLLTTATVENFEDACLVLEGYTYRWRIEQFHRAWKSDVCEVERSQLRSPQAQQKWATVLTAVAARALRLSYLARNQPDQPATDELTPFEIRAIMILKQKDSRWRAPRRREPRLGETVEWIAELGGYTGRSSGGPPGPKVIARGLDRIQSLAEGLAIMNCDSVIKQPVEKKEGRVASQDRAARRSGSTATIPSKPRH